MSTTASAVTGQRRADLARAAPQIGALLVLAALAWLWTYTRATSMGDMPGTMGLSLPAFVLMWGLMMTAMMLPSAAPLAALHIRTVQSHRSSRVGSFVLGYLVVWTASSVPAYALAWLADAAVDRSWGTAMAAAVFAANGIYQLTPLKYACLAHCRTPLGHLFHYASWRGRARDFRIGAHHGAYCLACCWSLMALMAAFGLMNLWTMVGLAVVVSLEKLWSRGAQFSKGIGVLSLALAVAVFFVPELAPGLTASPIIGMTGN